MGYLGRPDGSGRLAQGLTMRHAGWWQGFRIFGISLPVSPVIPAKAGIQDSQLRMTCIDCQTFLNDEIWASVNINSERLPRVVTVQS